MTSQQIQQISIDYKLETQGKSLIIDNAGLSYAEFRKGLKPRWTKIWQDIALGWTAVFAVLVFTYTFSTDSFAGKLILAGFGSVLIGYCIAYLQLFFHEAAHYNLHPSRQINDLLCHIFVGSIVGQDIMLYRPIHWDHHKHLGTPRDTEISYFNPLDVNFLVDSLFGARVLKVVMHRRKNLIKSSLNVEYSSNKSKQYSCRSNFFLIGITINLFLVTALAAAQAWVTLLSWIIGLVVFFPFFASIRQVLEHQDDHFRGVTADRLNSNKSIATNRLFGDGPIASTFGAAGFNRHLLHHWDSHISYTRLPDLEDFLLRTEHAPYLRSRHSTYLQTFRTLFRLRKP